MIGSTEIIVIAAVVLVLFGAAALPKFFRSLGKAKSEFQKGLAEGESKPQTEDQKTGEGRTERTEESKNRET